MIEQASLIIGDGNWAVKSDSLLGYKTIDGKYYPREMTFTRATTGTRVNAAGLVEIVPYNLVTWSEDFGNAIWQKQNTSAITNATIAPNGTLTANKLNENGANGYHSFSFPTGVITTTNPYTCSFYAKAAERTWCSVYLYDGTAYEAFFDLVNGVVGSVASGMTATIINVGNGWYRCTITRSVTINASTNGGIISAIGNNQSSYTGTSGSGIYVWGAQVVEGTQPLTYLPTTDRLDIPRIDYSTGSSALLLEPQRTNLFTYSESTNNFSSFGQSNTAYSSGNGFNGFQSSCKITFSTFTNSFPRAVLIYNAISGQNNYFTLHFKKKSGFYVKISFGNATSVFIIELNLGTGELISTSGTAVGNTKVLIIGDDTYQVGFLTSTNGTTSAGLLNIDFFNNSSFSNWTNSNASDFALISGIQWENQVTYGTSYIPTTGTSVTRNVDLCSKTGISSLIGQTEGTLYFQAKGLVDDSTYSLISLSDIGGANRISIGYANTATNLYFEYRVNSSYLINFNIGYIVKTDNNRIAVKYKLGEQAVFLNGVKIYSNTLSSAFTTALDRFSFDYNGGGFPYYGKVKALEIYTTSLTDAECIALTTP
jgi:hypothetical protein